MPINALSALEGNAGKPIYQMSKWWARRRSCVFRAMLIAAAMEAPVRKNPDGSPVLDDQGQPIPDETEAAKAVWDVYYANHQAAENFKHLKVLDCFMGGGTTLVEGSRLGFQVSGVDLNPVAWFIVKNELACTDPGEVKKFFDQIEAEVKPDIQPFYVTDCPRGHKGKWYELAGTGNPADDRLMPPDFDPVNLPPEERKKYRYEGPEIIYTFWAKHGPCSKPGCGHRTPVFRSPVDRREDAGREVHRADLQGLQDRLPCRIGRCPHGTSGRAHRAAQRDAVHCPVPAVRPAAAGVRRREQGREDASGGRAFRDGRKGTWAAMSQVRGVRRAVRPRRADRAPPGRDGAADIDKKHLKIQPARNSMKPVYCYLLIHPDWLKGSPGAIDGQELGGYSDAPVEATARWYERATEEPRARRSARPNQALGGHVTAWKRGNTQPAERRGGCATGSR